MRDYRLLRPPQSMRKSTVHLDNVALVPASLLPLKPLWQAIANDLPDGETLIILPLGWKQKRIARTVAFCLRGKGHRVRVVGKEFVEIHRGGG